MPDNADRAQRVIEQQASIDLTRRRVVAPVGEGPAECCLSCGLEIPAARQTAVPGTRHCAECAGFIERRRA